MFWRSLPAWQVRASLPRERGGGDAAADLRRGLEDGVGERDLRVAHEVVRGPAGGLGLLQRAEDAEHRLEVGVDVEAGAAHADGRGGRRDPHRLRPRAGDQARQRAQPALREIEQHAAGARPARLVAVLLDRELAAREQHDARSRR